MATKVKGGDLMVFMGGKSIALATNHTLSITGETQDTSNKDEGGGDWSSNEVSILSWEASTENMYTEDDGQGNTYEDLYDAMINKTKLSLVFAVKSGSGTDAPTGGWTAGTSGYKGSAYITSLELNAQNGDYASYTATFTGVGALTKNV